MSDINTVWSGTYGDWFLDVSNHLAAGDDLQTAVILSLFTDRQARTDDVISDGTGDRRGWWADPSFGSRLWLLDREKLPRDVAKRAKTYATEALKWLLDDQVVSKFDIVATVVVPSRLNLFVTAYRTGGPSVASQFTWAWKS
ncbi:MAG: hypothetical protein EPN62_08825 [Candidimonas sp.]|nr:MAG: hypothetical protein EPN77_06060 [Candidimonas sp.]TAM23770.1 MAG: hypothetical protein EPN62_08825 [Candidimonas sp.]